jgi:hypothetical protein
MSKTLLYAAAASALITATLAESPKEKETLPSSSPTQESQALAAKQIDAQITQLKDALEGMKSANEKGDRASFKLYRTQARDALATLDKLAASELATETKSAVRGSPSPTATPEASASALKSETSPATTPTATPVQ